MGQEDLGQENHAEQEEFDPPPDSTLFRDVAVESRNRRNRVLIFMSQIFLSKAVC